tara:strand:- start:5049 stop:5885 length:837 start_codon:yes stop_codon:yes gene_type:complete
MLSKVNILINYINWWLRLCLKIAILSLRLPYSFFQRIGIFRHGAMDRKDYVEQMWKLHFIDINELHIIDNTGSFLELGPGDSISSARKAKSAGFNHSILIDTDAFASDSEEIFRDLSDSNRTLDLKDSKNHYKCEYLTEGKKSLETLNEGKLSFAFSNSVLQHVNLEEVKSVLNELYRISGKGCMQSHIIDLRDMICRSSYHYDCPSYLWEAKFFQKFPIYTNRLRCFEWIESFTKAGFELVDVKIYDDFEQSLDPKCASTLDLNNSIANMHLIVRKN